MQLYRNRPAEKAPAEIEAGTLSAWKAAEFIGCSYRKLGGLRKARKGPKYIRIGRSIRYPRHLLIQWMDAVAEGGAS